MKSTQCVSVVPCYHLCCTEVKASASRCVFLKKPSIRTMICVLGKSKAQERAKSQQEQLHYGLFWDVKLQCATCNTLGSFMQNFKIVQFFIFAGNSFSINQEVIYLQRLRDLVSVSYTHLTLPTICSV